MKFRTNVWFDVGNKNCKNGWDRSVPRGTSLGRVHQNFNKNYNRTLKIRGIWLKFVAWSRITVLNKCAKFEGSRSKFGPSPHRRVYQNLQKNGKNTLKNCCIWPKFGIGLQIMLLNEYAKFDPNRPMLRPIPHRSVYQNVYKNVKRTLNTFDICLIFCVWSRIILLSK